ncbi:MAG TPA: hypothetical protein VH796_05645 [Nitrososphaeraceae archaeon]
MPDCNRKISFVGLSIALVLMIISSAHDYQVKSKTVSISCSNDKPCERTVCESSKACSTTIGESFESRSSSNTNSTTQDHQSNR